MGSFKSSNGFENNTANSHVVDASRSGMEDIVNNRLFAKTNNASKTSAECFRPTHKISLEQSCSTGKTFNFDKNDAYFQSSKNTDSSMYLTTEFETIRTDAVKKNLSSHDQNRISLLQDKIVSSSVENVQIIENFDSGERVSSSKERYSVRDGRGLRERSKNSSVQKGGKPSFIKISHPSSLSLLACKAEIKALPSNQSNFQRRETGALVDEAPSEKGPFVDNISQPAPSKKRKYKVKVKVRRKKIKRKSSPPPPPPPPKLSSLSNFSPSPPPPPPPPRLPRPSQSQAPFLSQPSYPRSLLPSPLMALPIPSISFPPGPSIPNYPPGNSQSRNVPTLPSYPPEMLTTIPNYQLQQAVQTSQCTVGGLQYLQATGHNIPFAVHNSYPSFFPTPHGLVFYSNYPSTLNTHAYMPAAPGYAIHK